MNINKPAHRNIWIHRISDITSKRISIKPLSAGRYLLISCYKVQCFYDMFAKICFTWFCLFFVEVANSSFWGSNIGNCMFNLWQSDWYFLFCFIWLFAYLLQCQMHLFDMQISWHKIIHCIKSASLFQM